MHGKKGDALVLVIIIFMLLLLVGAVFFAIKYKQVKERKELEALNPPQPETVNLLLKSIDADTQEQVETDFTVDSCFTVANTVPYINSFTLLPTELATDVNCSFTFTDIENATQSYTNETRWYVNGSLISEATNRTLLAGNATLNANISCEAKVYDGVNYSSPLNSSILVVGDTVVPSFQSGSATNVTTAESSNITAILLALLAFVSNFIIFLYLVF